MQTFDAERPAEHPGTGPSARPDIPRRATATENLLTLLGGTWLVVGLFIDGYAHSELIDTETEDFFTPWHAIFYSGFLVTAAIIGWVAIRRSAPGPLRDWLPPGYGWAAVGISLFAIGGLGDGVWHTIFGVENGIDALLSPTHLFLFVGMVLILSTPFRAFWLDPERRGRWSDAGGAIVSMAVSTALVTFFFTYAFGIGEAGPQQAPFDPITEVNEEAVELGLATAYTATAILVLPLLALLRRTDLPAGAVVVLWTIPTLLEGTAFGGEPGISLPAVIIGAVTIELLLATLRSRLGRRGSIIAAVGLGTLVTWTVWMAMAEVLVGVAWVPELWSGQIVMCGIAATALAAIAFPPALPTPEATPTH